MHKQRSFGKILNWQRSTSITVFYPVLLWILNSQLCLHQSGILHHLKYRFHFQSHHFRLLWMFTLYHCTSQVKLLQHPERAPALTNRNLSWTRFHVPDLGERGVVFVCTPIANYVCAWIVVNMGAEVAVSGALSVREEEAGILSVVVAITVIHCSPKWRLVKFGRAAFVVSSFF